MMMNKTKLIYFICLVICICIFFLLVQFSFVQEKAVAGEISTIHSLLSGEGKIFFGEEPNSIMVIDFPQNIRRIEDFINMVDVRAKQVLIDARVVEVILADETALGINWDWYLKELAGFDVDTPIQQLIPYKGREAAGTFVLTVFDEHIQFVLRTLAQHVETELLSAPKITTLSGKKATINVVQEVPWVEITVEQGIEGEGDTITYEVTTEEVGITLEVTPVISPDGLISMKLKPEVSEVANWFAVPVLPGLKYEVPVIDTRRAETNVMINDGQTLIIGGMIRDKIVKEKTKVPLLGDIPILGHLFKGTRTTKEKTELLILVSATIVDPAELSRMALEERYGIGRRHTLEREAREKRHIEKKKMEEGEKLKEKVESIYQKGKQAYNHGKYGKAVFYFQTVLGIHPDHKRAEEYLKRVKEKIEEIECRKEAGLPRPFKLEKREMN